MLKRGGIQEKRVYLQRSFISVTLAGKGKARLAPPIGGRMVDFVVVVVVVA